MEMMLHILRPLRYGSPYVSRLADQ